VSFRQQCVTNKIFTAFAIILLNEQYHPMKSNVHASQQLHR
jgi:hypothetical protein